MDLVIDSRPIREGLALAAVAGVPLAIAARSGQAVTIAALIRPDASTATFSGSPVTFDAVGHYHMQFSSGGETRRHDVLVFSPNAAAWLAQQCGAQLADAHATGSAAALIMQSIANEPRARLTYAPILAAHANDVDGGMTALGIQLEDHGFSRIASSHNGHVTAYMGTGNG